MAEQLAERAVPQAAPPPAPSIIFGEFLGFGDEDQEQQQQ
jgi:hypothetical protein